MSDIIVSPTVEDVIISPATVDVIVSTIGIQGPPGIVIPAMPTVAGVVYGLTEEYIQNANTALGELALGSNQDGTNNLAVGTQALENNISGHANTAVGLGALASVQTTDSNTAIGETAGANTTGYGNVFIGYAAGHNETGNNTLYIANSSTSTPLIKGDFSAQTLTINGQLTAYIDGGSA